MISFNRVLRHLINITSIRSNLNQRCCRNVRSLSTIKYQQSNDFRKKTEKLSFNTVQNTGADIFGTLNDNVEINAKLDSLPPEPDDIVRFDNDKQHKRLHINEYHKIVQELIKQNKVYIFFFF